MRFPRVGLSLSRLSLDFKMNGKRGSRHAARLRWTRCAVISLALLVACGSPSPGDRAGASQAVDGRPNVLFVFYDQFRVDLIGAYGGHGNIRTPHLDRLAREGVLFTNGLSTVPVSAPYRGMLMTGRFPTHTGMMVNLLEANTSFTNVADVSGAAGYRTAFMGKWMLAAGSHKMAWVGGLADLSSGSIQAYTTANPHYNFVPPGPARLGFEYWAAYNFHLDFLAAPYYRDAPRELVMDGFESDALTDMAIEYMDDARNAGDPFFIMVARHPPHPPFDQLPDGYLEKVPETLLWDQNVPADFRVGSNHADARAYLAMAKDLWGLALPPERATGIEPATLSLGS